MIHRMRKVMQAIIPISLVVLAACGSGSDEESLSSAVFARAESAPAAPAFPAGALQESFADAATQSQFGFGVAGPPAAAVPPAPSGAAPAAAPAPVPTPAPVAASLAADHTTEQEVALVAQQRIIVRTVDMELVVSGVPASIDDIAKIAQDLGGWVVAADRTRRHSGTTSIRVPADRLDDAIRSLRDLAIEVEAEVTTSRDVTDEYVDLTARLTNLVATEESLLKLFDKAVQVEDALAVQKELTVVQGEIERLQGRIAFLEQTSAFSLITVGLRLSPIDMVTDVGLDQTVSVGRAARFRASFTPPEGIEDFSFSWDFGDGSPRVFGERTAPAVGGDARFTSTVTHVYGDDDDSPFIVEFKISGTGESGVTEGEDTLIVTVTKVPEIEVFAGESRVVEEGEEVEVAGSFTRPDELSDLSFRWNFGDGSAPITGDLAEGVTRAVAVHTYANFRPAPFVATLTVSGHSEAGEVEAESRISVLVIPAPPIEVFAGNNVAVDEGEEFELVGSFTRPEGVSDLKFEWEFGDGSASITGDLAEGETNAVATHVYSDDRPFPFRATLTVTGDRDGREVKSSGSVNVFVAESPGWVLSGWSASDNWKTATRALSRVGQGAGTFFIWVGIFSPVWIAAGAVIVVVRRRR